MSDHEKSPDTLPSHESESRTPPQKPAIGGYIGLTRNENKPYSPEDKPPEPRMGIHG